MITLRVLQSCCCCYCRCGGGCMHRCDLHESCSPLNLTPTLFRVDCQKPAILPIGLIERLPSLGSATGSRGIYQLLLFLVDRSDYAPSSIMAPSNIEDTMASANIEEKAYEPDPIVDEVTSDSVQLYPVKWYRSTIFNTVIVSMTTFMGVGMFTALQNTGAGGLQDVTTGMCRDPIAAGC